MSSLVRDVEEHLGVRPRNERPAVPPARPAPAPRVVVVGAGFAGLAAVRRLARAPVEVTLVDGHNFHTFQPLLYQVATAGLGPGDVAYPVRTIFGRRPNVRFVHALATGVDLAAGQVELEGGAHHLGYDYLVVATGARAASFGVPGVVEHAFRLYTLEDARRLRNRVLSVLEKADAADGKEGRAQPVFVVVGGGPTGVETAGAIVELLATTVRRDRLRIDPERARIVLFDALDELLTGFPVRLGRYARRVLAARGVEVRLGERVAEVGPKGVRLASGEEVAADAVIWVAGVSVDGTFAATLAGTGAANAKGAPGGRVVLRPDLSLEHHPEVFVVGDAAAVPTADGRGWCPQVAQVAIQSGDHAARAVLRRLHCEPAKAFAYRDKGMMATIGRRAAVARLRNGITLRGTPGWLAWLGLHLVYLIGFRNRAVVLVNWAWRYFRWPSGPRLIFGSDAPEPAHSID
jgi:NADH:ubiquinone reductase (H+-translocating)